MVIKVILTEVEQRTNKAWHGPWKLTYAFTFESSVQQSIQAVKKKWLDIKLDATERKKKKKTSLHRQNSLLPTTAGILLERPPN